MKAVRACVLTGYGLNCDYETDFCLNLAGAHSERIHINKLIPSQESNATITLDSYHILVLGGGFSWADDHGAGVIMASKLKYNIGEQVEKFIGEGKLIIGICNGFQTLVNLGLLPGFDGDYHSRKVALTYNDSGNFVDRWVTLRVQEDSICIFTKGISTLELPVRHGEGKFYAKKEIIDRLIEKNQVVVRYADEEGHPAHGRWPFNPNGSLYDIAGVCDSTGRIFGVMPHPEAYNHYTNHPDWTRKREELARMGKKVEQEEGEGVTIFRNAVKYIKKNL